jgi:catechol 2,3-dioxygenase-like lactoylglutathione lyase family enzyme
MIDHIILTVSDFERSVAFYVKALKPLGITNFTDYEGKNGHPDLKGFGDGKRAFFWLKEGKPDPQAVHVGFAAKDHAEVDAFYKAAVDAGGKSKEAPQARPEYYPGYYATWCSILTATISRSFIRAKLIFEGSLLSGRRLIAGEIRRESRFRTFSATTRSLLWERPRAT